MHRLPESWPESPVRVQIVAQSCASTIPDRYVKPPSLRPCFPPYADGISTNIPIVDLGGGCGDPPEAAVDAIKAACRDWGFFQVVNHGVPLSVMHHAVESWRAFFHQPAEYKERFANDARTYEGYGSRLGTTPGASLDWGDYFFLHYRPTQTFDKWPDITPELVAAADEYEREVSRMCRRVLSAISRGLGLPEGRLGDAFGGESGDLHGVCMRVNYYPPCPQPDLALGLSPHSDPGGVTVLLADRGVCGLQVRRGDEWIAVEPVAGGLIVNVGDQIQFLTNGAYKSVEHRVVVNPASERLSMAFFYNPKNDIPVAPLPELVSPQRPALYRSMSFDEHRLYLRTVGLRGKNHIEDVKVKDDVDGSECR